MQEVLLTSNHMPNMPLNPMASIEQANTAKVHYEGAHPLSVLWADEG